MDLRFVLLYIVLFIPRSETVREPTKGCCPNFFCKVRCSRNERIDYNAECDGSLICCRPADTDLHTGSCPAHLCRILCGPHERPDHNARCPGNDVCCRPGDIDLHPGTRQRLVMFAGTTSKKPKVLDPLESSETYDQQKKTYLV